MNRAIFLFFFFLSCVSFSPYITFAGSFRVVPVKLFFNERSKTETITVTNYGKEEVTIQLDASHWSQDDLGNDLYEPTRDIIFFPRIVTIAQDEKSVIRVGYQGEPVSSKEKTYRLFLQELPVTKPGEKSLKFTLRMSVPLFCRPTKEIQEQSIEDVSLKGGKLTVQVKNNGNSHRMVGKILVKGQDSTGREVFTKEANGWYVLAGKIRAFAIDIPEDGCMQSSSLMAQVLVDKTNLEKTMPVEQVSCKAPAPASGKKPHQEK